jgi:hypothetical protein
MLGAQFGTSSAKASRDSAAAIFLGSGASIGKWSWLTPEEWRRIRAHVRTHDHPEIVSRWRELGREAGFGTVQEHFVAPSNLFRLFSFQL